MKYLTLTRRIALTLLVLLTTTTLSWAQYPDLELLNGYTLTAYAENSYEISSLADWNALADYVADNHNCSGLFFKMTANIGSAAEPVQKPLGKQIDNKKTRRRFAGNFDGDGHTLYVNIDNNNNPYNWYQYNASYCAPFAYAQKVTVKNLHVTGYITTTGQFASGIVGQSGPDNNQELGVCTIENCHVSVIFECNTPNGTYGNHGTFLAIAEAPATIKNCWFDGQLTGSNYYYSGGFIGQNKKAGTTLNNCLFNPSVINITNNNIGGSSEFSRNLQGSSTQIDCYYTKSFSEPENAQGIRVFETYVSGSTVDPVVAADGETYYIIKNNILWTDIIDAIANSATTLTLTNDVLAGTEDVAIVVPSDKTFELQLNGYTLDRGLDVVSADSDGCLFKVYGNLTILGGTLRGGNNTGNGGAIYNEGTLNMSNITVTGNYAPNGAGIYMHGGTLSLSNCTITGNKGTNNNSKGIGVYVENGTFNIEGAVQIQDNQYNKVYKNVYLKTGKIINVTGNITGAIVKVSMQTPGVITNGLNGNGTVSNFASDVADYVVRKVDNEAKLVRLISRSITGYGETNGQWAFISSPILADVDPKDVNGLKSNNYDLYSFDQSNDPLEWINYKNHQNDFVLENGKGYLYANSKTVTLKFAGDMNTANSKVVNLDYDENARLAGYNLVGNPLTVAAYIDRPYYKMNADGTDIEAELTSTENQIAVCSGAIVVADGANETVTFSKTAPESGSKGSIKMSLAKAGTRGNNEMQDKAIVSFNEGIHLAKYIFNEDHAKLYIPQDGKDYAIVSSERKGEMPVNFEAKEMGSYTINIEGEDLTGAYLVDKIEGAVIDLSVNTSYTFIGASSDRTDRFKLVFDAKASDFANENFAYQSGNDIVVNGEGTLQVFDVAGRMVTSTTVGGVETLDAMPQGVYIFRLIGSEVRTQKIVIR